MIVHNGGPPPLLCVPDWCPTQSQYVGKYISKLDFSIVFHKYISQLYFSNVFFNSIFNCICQPVNFIFWHYLYHVFLFYRLVVLHHSSDMLNIRFCLEMLRSYIFEQKTKVLTLGRLLGTWFYGLEILSIIAEDTKTCKYLTANSWQGNFLKLFPYFWFCSKIILRVMWRMYPTSNMCVGKQPAWHWQRCNLV